MLFNKLGHNREGIRKPHYLYPAPNNYKWDCLRKKGKFNET